MNDRRVSALREALVNLLDSANAASRLRHWGDVDPADPIPESLLQSASDLEKRLTHAKQLTADSFTGTPLVMSRLNGLSDAVRRLDRAYADFCASISAEPNQLPAVLQVLDAEIDGVKAEMERWS